MSTHGIIFIDLGTKRSVDEAAIRSVMIDDVLTNVRHFYQHIQNGHDIILFSDFSNHTSEKFPILIEKMTKLRNNFFEVGFSVSHFDDGIIKSQFASYEIDDEI